MRFHYQVGMFDPDHYVPLARAAEAAGYDGITLPDSICYPKEADSRYPYNADGSREFLDGLPFIESLIAVTAMATVTKEIRFSTFVYKLGVRQPVAVAKQVQGIQRLSGNRFDFGVGISPWAEDFAVMQVPWENRGRRLDEQIDILRGLDSGEYFEFHGEFYDIPALKMNPVPEVPTKILIGGHSDAALKRAARNDGWMCAGANLEQLTGYLERLNGFRAAAGNVDPLFRVFTAGHEAYSNEGIARLEELGVTDVVIGFRNVYQGEPDVELDAKIADLERYANTFMRK